MFNRGWHLVRRVARSHDTVSLSGGIAALAGCIAVFSGCSSPSGATLEEGTSNFSTTTEAASLPVHAQSPTIAAMRASGTQRGTQGCAYPSGPYGTGIGNVVDPNLHWDGYAPGSRAVTTLRTSDFFDCDGSKGINALLIDVSTVWCPHCQDEAPAVESNLEGDWGTHGVKALTLLIQENDGSPATTQSALDWTNNYTLNKVSVAADPANNFAANAFPTNFLVDPRTMTIVAIHKGYNPYDSSPDDLAKKNATH